VSRALAEINAIQAIVGKSAPPEPIELRAALVPLAEQIAHRSRAGLEMLLAAVGVVLMIGCVNITNLVLARATNRRKEIAIRSAMGASFGRLLWQMLTESVLLSLFGAAVGIALAQGLLQVVLRYVPIDLPRMDEVRLDGRVMGFTLALSVATSLLCGLLPAWYFAKVDPQDAMKASSRVTTPGPVATRLQSVLVGAEVGLSAVCLIAGGLLLHSLVRLLVVDRGFETAHVVALDLSLPALRYPTLPARAAFFRSAIAQLEALPEISSVGVTNSVPASGQSGNNVVVPEGADSSFYESPIADVRSVNAEFFETMTIPLRSGRVFRESDGERAVALVSTSLAERAWPGQNPIGRRFRLGSPTSRSYDVVGVVGEVRGVSLSQQTLSPSVYVPYWIRDFSRTSLLVKTTKDPVAAYAAIRRVVRTLDSELPIPAPRTMEDVVTASVAPRRFQMQMVLAFAATALFLAALGIYGVVSYSVGQRTGELGLRMALGASPGNVSRIVLSQAMLPVACGLAAGVVAAAGIGRALRSMLFGVTPLDPATLVLVPVVLTVVAGLASYIPARRATRVDPIVALRTE
jgi:putative ABC transport system permease protein